MTIGDSTSSIEDRELVIERVLDAPRELVFKMWSDPHHYRKWAYPVDGFKVTHLEMDFQVGGIYRICLRSPEGVDYWIRGNYREIVEPEWFTRTNAWENKDGSISQETLFTVTFEAIGEKTKLTLHQAEFDSVEDRDSQSGGWDGTLDSLVSYLESTPLTIG